MFICSTLQTNVGSSRDLIQKSRRLKGCLCGVAIIPVPHPLTFAVIPMFDWSLFYVEQVREWSAMSSVSLIFGYRKTVKAKYVGTNGCNSTFFSSSSALVAGAET